MKKITVNKKQNWDVLSKDARIALLEDDSFPYMEICEEIINSLPIEAGNILVNNGFLTVDECRYFLLEYERHDDQGIDDSVWNSLSEDAKDSLYSRNIMPKQEYASLNGICYLLRLSNCLRKKLIILYLMKV